MREEKETRKEMISRLYQMADPKGKWDLSDNDRSAINFMLDELHLELLDIKPKTPVDTTRLMELTKELAEILLKHVQEDEMRRFSR